jgi:hypothetical protein
MAEAALRLYVEGYSSNKRGRDPEWVEKSLDFTLAGIRKGSTILVVKAPPLTETLGDYQQPLYDELGVKSIKKQSAISLGLRAYEKATRLRSEEETLDKNLLNVMLGFKKLFDGNTKGRISIGAATGKKQIVIAQKSLQKIKVLEEATPIDQRIKLTGKLEMMRHSTNLLELINASGKYKAHLSKDLTFEKAKSFFGEEVTCTGVAHYNPRGKVISIEITELKPAESASHFKNAPDVIQTKLDLPGLVTEQSYKGTSSVKLKRIITDLNIDDDLNELLEVVNS